MGKSRECVKLPVLTAPPAAVDDHLSVECELFPEFIPRVLGAFGLCPSDHLPGNTTSSTLLRRSFTKKKAVFPAGLPQINTRLRAGPAGSQDGG